MRVSSEGNKNAKVKKEQTKLKVRGTSEMPSVVKSINVVLWLCPNQAVLYWVDRWSYPLMYMLPKHSLHTIL